MMIKEYTKQVIHNTVVHPLLTDAQPHHIANSVQPLPPQPSPLIWAM